MFCIQQLSFIFASLFVQVAVLQGSQNNPNYPSPGKSPTAIVPQQKKLVTRPTLADLKTNGFINATLGGSSLNLLKKHSNLTDEEKKRWETQHAKDYAECKVAWQAGPPQKNRGCFCFGSTKKKKKQTKQLH